MPLDHHAPTGGRGLRRARSRVVGLKVLFMMVAAPVLQRMLGAHASDDCLARARLITGPFRLLSSLGWRS